MWQIIVDRMPDWVGLLGTAAAFAIPYATYKINSKLHQLGDPPWKDKSDYDRGK